jgi:hypothetical protein
LARRTALYRQHVVLRAFGATLTPPQGGIKYENDFYI